MIDKMFLFILVFVSFLFQSAFSQTFNIPSPHVEDPSELVLNELKMIESLIQATRLNLKNLTKLQEQMQKYQKLQEEYFQHPENNEVLFQMIKCAHSILEGIKESRLTQSFDPAFLSELTIVSKPANKLGIPRP